MRNKYKWSLRDIVKNANFDGNFEFPIIYREHKEIIPRNMVSFDKRKKLKNKKDYFIHFYLHDEKFVQLLNNPNKYIEEIKDFGGVISPDFSLYRDMPYIEQANNTYINRALGHYMQSNGIYVIPNVRWSDRRSFDYCFDGLETNGLYSISTHGCIKKKDDKHYFKQGLDEFIKKLKPKIVLVYGAMPKDIFNKYHKIVKFINYPSYISQVFSGGKYGNRN